MKTTRTTHPRTLLPGHGRAGLGLVGLGLVGLGLVGLGCSTLPPKTSAENGTSDVAASASAAPAEAPAVAAEAARALKGLRLVDVDTEPPAQTTNLRAELEKLRAEVESPHEPARAFFDRLADVLTKEVAILPAPDRPRRDEPPVAEMRAYVVAFVDALREARRLYPNDLRLRTYVMGATYRMSRNSASHYLGDRALAETIRREASADAEAMGSLWPNDAGVLGQRALTCARERGANLACLRLFARCAELETGDTAYCRPMLPHMKSAYEGSGCTGQAIRRSLTLRDETGKHRIEAPSFREVWTGTTESTTVKADLTELHLKIQELGIQLSNEAYVEMEGWTGPWRPGLHLRLYDGEVRLGEAVMMPTFVWALSFKDVSADQVCTNVSQRTLPSDLAALLDRLTTPAPR